jgi:hypothetical protein
MDMDLPRYYFLKWWNYPQELKFNKAPVGTRLIHGGFESKKASCRDMHIMLPPVTEAVITGKY